MTDAICDHGRLDGYRLAVEYTADSLFECAAIQDVLTASGDLAPESHAEWKLNVKRIVSMLTPMVMNSNVVSESQAGYQAAIDYDYEHEHEHE